LVNSKPDWLDGDAKAPVSPATALLRAWAVPAIAMLSAIWVFAVAMYGIGIGHSSLPQYDDWEEVSAAQHFFNLFGQYNEHRFALSRLFFIVDKSLFAGSTRFTLAALIAIQLTHALLLTFVFSRTRNCTRREFLLAASLAVSLLFWLVQHETLVWSFNIHFVAIFTLATAAFATYALVPGWRGTAVSIGLAVVAAFTMANGTFVLVLLVGLAIMLRRPMIEILLLAASAILTFGVFFIGYKFWVLGAPQGSWLEVADQCSRFSLMVLGSPFEQALRAIAAPHLTYGTPALWLGGLGVAGFLLLTARCLVGRNNTAPAQYVLLYVMAFVLVTTAMTAAGRIVFGLPTALSSRYCTPTLIFWLAAILLSWSFVKEARRRRALVDGGVVAICLVVAMTQVPLLANLQPELLRQREKEASVLSGITDPGVLIRMHPDPKTLRAQVALMKSARSSIFANDWANWLGSSISDVAASSRSCAGHLDAITPLATGGEWRVRGWAWNTRTRTVPSLVLLANRNGTIVGYGRFGEQRPDVLEADRGVTDLLSGWVGYFSSPKAAPIEAYAFDEQSRTVCPLLVSAPGWSP
jgi:hypothetical protein